MLPQILSPAKKRFIRNGETAQPSLRIPPEVFLIIVQYLPVDDKATLISMLFTCRTLHNITEELLYNDVIISDKTSKSQSLFERLAARPDLAAHVHKLEWPKKGALPIGKPLFLRLRGTRARDQYLASIPMAISGLQSMRNVRRLTIGKLPSPSILDSIDLLVPAIGEMKLKKLSISSVRWSWSNEIIPILRSQPGLRSLRLPWQDRWEMGEGVLIPTDIPRLVSLHCAAFTAARIVPGRPIERLLLRISPQMRWSEGAVWDNLALSAKHISYLTFHIFDSKNIDISWILEKAATHMKYVTSLEISPMIYDNIADEMKYDCDKMTADMARFKMLQSYRAQNTVITGTLPSRAAGWSTSRTTHRASDELLRIWKEACPWLEVVIVNVHIWEWIDPHLGWGWRPL
ncbi:hypothetical protein FRB94_006870 [Tulasnella sp. JGI-2019a]|nr:hypothetical protein FRB94_006870 [Tulasnella sp. JGI-2019a]KAG9035856.1 hypothetical protein FRB95_010450 [Tulasnella sp. JGI-2019a]